MSLATENSRALTDQLGCSLPGMIFQMLGPKIVPRATIYSIAQKLSIKVRIVDVPKAHKLIVVRVE